MFKTISLLVFLIGIISCQQKPTKVLGEQSLQGRDRVSVEKFRLDNPVILDVRSPFEFNILHLPGAINVRWEDFSQNDPSARGLLQRDLFSLARRLALIGVEPSRKVLVVGKGQQGQGEEGRVAWTLQVLGVKEVLTLRHDYFRELHPQEALPPVKNASYWKPNGDESLTVELREFRSLVDTASDVIVVDVRSAAEFEQQSLAKKISAPLVNIPWKEFFTEQGSPRPRLLDWLASKGVATDKTILIVSNHGVRSGAVTYALRHGGIAKARNFAGGLEQWRAKK